MLWPFNHFRRPHAPQRGTIEAIYGMIVAQAREPLFYRAMGVPDTVNGRFDMVLLHLWMVLRRLRPTEGGAELSPGAVRPFLRRHGRQSARNGRRRSHRAQAHAEIRRGVLRTQSPPTIALWRRARSRWRRRCARISWTEATSATRGSLRPMPMPSSPPWPGSMMRPSATGRGGFRRRRRLRPRGEQSEQHDRPRKSLERSGCGGADSRHRNASGVRHQSGRTKRARRSRRLARGVVRQCVARSDADARGARARHRAASRRGSDKPAWSRSIRSRTTSMRRSI